MDIDVETVPVHNNVDARHYEAHVNGHLALITYQQEGSRIVFNHTKVPAELEGHGIAGRMAHVALEDARARHLSVIPRCPFVASYIRRHPEYLDLVPVEERALLVPHKTDE